MILSAQSISSSFVGPLKILCHIASLYNNITSNPLLSLPSPLSLNLSFLSFSYLHFHPLNFHQLGFSNNLNTSEGYHIVFFSHKNMKESGRKQGTMSPCAACKLLRRRCTRDCVFAPYFPAHEPQKFGSVHKVFGASNVNKMLQVQILMHLPFLYHRIHA